MRKFENFLTSYEQYADDAFVPKQFNTWVALSIIAGALERRVWLPWNDTFSFYPNIYVLLVSKPGVGKSVALNKGVDLLQEMNRKAGTLNIMPSQVTEAKFIELMGHGRSWTDRSIPGKELVVFQNSGYYFASEASNSLRNIFGDFLACLTDFYDCPAFWERATKKDGKKIALKNVCMNILAGSTFDYLGKLVSDENIQGGFASRLLYVVHAEKLVRNQKFQSGFERDDREERRNFRACLVNDLSLMNQMSGPMYADADFSAAWEKWYPVFEEKRQAYESEKLQSIVARTNTSVLKVSMLLSAAESDDRTMKLRHFVKAVELVEGLNAQIPGIFREAKAGQSARAGGTGPANFILKTVIEFGQISQASIVAKANCAGHRGGDIGAVVQSLIIEGILGAVGAAPGEGALLVLKGNPDKYL